VTIIVPVRETLSSHVRPTRAQDQSEAEVEAPSSPAAPLPPDGGSDRDRAIDAQAFRSKAASKSGRSGTEADMANLSKAVCHVESDQGRFGNRSMSAPW
jgi:hypothetical protein